MNAKTISNIQIQGTPDKLSKSVKKKRRAMMKYTCAARSWGILLQILKLLRDTLRRHDGSPGKSLKDIFFYQAKDLQNEQYTTHMTTIILITQNRS